MARTSPMALLRRSLALEERPPANPLAECEACMWLLIERAQSGTPLSPPEFRRFVLAQQRARVALCLPSR